MWMQGKVYQVLGNDSEALRLFLRALEINPSQVDVAREASISAMAINRSEDAIYYARRALQSQPSNVGLKANLALALLLAGKLPEAKEVIDNAVATGKADTITRTLSSMIEHFIATGEKPPTTATALEDYWRNMGST
jgi:Flp pilus assembly protein TadD